MRRISTESHATLTSCRHTPLSTVKSGNKTTPKSLSFFPQELIGEISSFLGTDDGRLAFSQTSRNIRLVTSRLDPRTKVIPHLLCTIEGHEEEVSCIICTPDGKIVTGSLDATAKVWDCSGQLLFSLEGHTAEISCLAATADGKIITGSWDNTAKIWNQEGHLLATLAEHTATVTAVAVTANGKIITGGSDSRINIWTSEGILISSYQNNDAQVTDLVLINDQKIVIGFRNGKIEVLDLGINQTVISFRAHNDEFTSLLVLPNGNILTNAYGEEIRLWDSVHGNLLKRVYSSDKENLIISFALTSDGRIAAQFNNNTLQILDFDLKTLATCDCDAQFLFNENKGLVFLDEDSDDPEITIKRGVVSLQLVNY